MPLSTHLLFFFFNDTATTEIYTLSLHDALPISHRLEAIAQVPGFDLLRERGRSIKHQVMDHLDFYLEQFSTNVEARGGDRKSTRLNSSHSQISYAVFCLKKKKRWQLYSCRRMVV